MPDFEAFPFWLNGLAFAAGAAVIWIAGTRLSRYAAAIADRTGVGKAFIGALLLGGITSLPEVATTVTASAIGSAPLAVNNIFGGVAMQVVVLAVADAIVPGRSLSVRIRSPVVLLQAALLVLILSLAIAGMVVGDVPIFGVGAWTLAILGASLLAFYLIRQDGSHATWEPEAPPSPEAESEAARAREAEGARGYSTGRLVLFTSLAALAILVAGFAVAKTGDVLAVQTGLGASFVGVLFVAVATSLPEASTTISAVRLGQNEMAFSNIFGANILDLSVLFLADLVFRGGPVLNEVGRFSQIGALLGVLVTGVYMVGLLERRKRVVMGVGWDSLLVLLLYAGGMFLLYTLR